MTSKQSTPGAIEPLAQCKLRTGDGPADDWFGAPAPHVATVMLCTWDIALIASRLGTATAATCSTTQCSSIRIRPREN